MNNPISFDKKALSQIIEEGRIIKEGLDSPFWGLIKRTILAQIEDYKQDCYEAAKDSSKNLANFFGRLEALERLLQIVEKEFVEAGLSAFEKLKALEEEEKENESLDEFTSHIVNKPIYKGDRPGFIG